MLLGIAATVNEKKTPFVQWQEAQQDIAAVHIIDVRPVHKTKVT